MVALVGSYNIWIVALSFIIAFFTSYQAFGLFKKISRIPGKVAWGWMIIASIVMGCGIWTIHFVGNVALQLPVSVEYERDLYSIPTGLLIGLIFAIGVTVLLTWFTQIWEQLFYKKMAFTDSLTGLNNRHAMNMSFRNPFLFQKTFAIMFIDLDQFKYINDTLGHDVGDMLIQEIGVRFKKQAASNQQVFRIGGDEFMVMMPFEQKSDVRKAVEQLLEEIRKPLIINGHRLEVTGSIGISYSEEHGDTKDKLLKSADTAMYHAKSLGKNQYCEYNEQMEQKLMRKMDVEKGLREALIKDTLQLYYQPKWDIVPNRPIGFEALLRFQHPVLGPISPDEFIPIAEETGLIIQLTEWVLQRACHDGYEWNQVFNSELSVSVNISSRVIESNVLQEMIEHALSSTGLSPSLLELEITEQTMIRCGASVSNQLLPLQQLGVKLSMDNFGSGYSFLGSVERLQFQTIKIDRTYIENYDLPTKRAIVNSVISLANELNVQLVAEGVETEAQLRLMQEAGCRVFQGFYFKEPMPVCEVEEWLKGL